MKKENIIKKSKDFQKIINNGKKYTNRYFNLFIYQNDETKTRFGICVSKKIGNAVTRNKNKRQIKDIIDKSNLIFSNKKDYVIILKKEINILNFNEKKENLIKLLEGAINEK